MPPDMVIGLMLVSVGHDSVTLRWMQPGLGTGQLTGYEFQVGSGPWRPTMSVLTTTTVYGLDPGAPYQIRVRAVTTVGRGSPSVYLDVQTLAIAAPSVVRYVEAEPTGRPSVVLEWHAPESDGGESIGGYQVCVVNPDGTVEPFVSTGSTERRHTVRGLAFWHRYGFRVRAANSAGPGPPSETVYAVPVRFLQRTIPVGQRIPLLDVDRQSLIVRLAGIECRIIVWWQPSDAGWWASLEVPVNTPVIRSRRLALNSGILDRITDVLPGNLVLREIGSTGAEPQRNAWARPTHALVYEPSTD